jgi:aryl-alcohol dehydrogenase-like predicted oxidoreductase
MEYTRLGNSGLEVSKLCLGTMSFGDKDKWIHPWVLNEEDSRTIIKRALELGINFFDTANIYSKGTSEEYVGRALRDFANRDEIVLATKVHGRMHDGPNGGGLSRKAIMSEIDKSLARLETDYVDLYIIHRFDEHTPLEETMEALHDVVKSGKARYIGASAMYAWQFQKAQHIAEKNGWTKFISMQNHMNLIYREEEREMLPLCKDQGVGITPYSPLASGRLVKDKDEQTARSQTDQIQRNKYDDTQEKDQIIVDRVKDIAEKYNVPRIHVALAWLMQKDMVASPIIGATKLAHLEQAVGALDLTLSADDLTYLEEAYVPHNVVGPI